MHIADSSEPQGVEHHLQYFKVRREAGLAEQLAAYLARRARAAECIGARAQHGAQIAQAHHSLVGKMTGGDTGCLWRHVAAQAQQASAGGVG